MKRTLSLSIVSLFSLALGACGGSPGTDVGNNTELIYAEGSPEALAVVAVANDTTLGVEEFDSSDVVGLHARAAENLVAHRDGDDPNSTDDDNLFDDLREVMSVSYCKRACVESLLDYAEKTGVYVPGGTGNGDISVIFSPQSPESSHLAEIADRIDGAQDTIDIAMYSYSHSGDVKAAIERAVNRGIQIRFLANTDLANSASKAAPLEAMGIDVRRVTKIMHHKLAIIDGPRDDASLGRAATATLVTGSGNWSTSAATRYDENTLFMTGYPELTLRVQRDFDTLWAGSKDKVWEDLVWDQTRANITDVLIAENDSPDTDAFFTSVNFKPTASQGWSVVGTTAVTDELVRSIGLAQTSLEIASGHFVSEPIAAAVANAIDANPNLDVRIALDCQETSKGGNIGALKDAIEASGGSIHYKCNTYRWHYTMAAQMHHKYMIIDSTDLYTGSLNFSDNAETNTFENMLKFSGAAHAGLIASYQANLEQVRGYGRENNLAALDDLKDSITNGSSVPLTWTDAISMDLDTFMDLKDLIRAECPATKSWEDTGPAKTYNKHFSKNAHWFKSCSKNGYPWPNVPVSERVL